MLSYKRPHELDPDAIEWLVNQKPSEQPDQEDLINWMVVDEKNDSIENEIIFCDKTISKDLIQKLNQFEKLSDRTIDSIRKRVNPFELIGRSVFLDRAACKLANIDALCDFMFTNPVDSNGQSLIAGSNQPLLFAAIEGQPGGFVNYMLWRKGSQTKGFGITRYRFETDRFKLPTLPCFIAHDNREITKAENIVMFIDFIKKQTESSNIHGVHVVIADCALKGPRARKSKEIDSKHLHISSLAAALGVLRPNGHFIMKIFDSFTPFTVGLIYLTYKCFQQISIVKPCTSRPANAERYIIGKWKLPNTDIIQQHLFEAAQFMGTDEGELTELVDLDVLRKDSRFFDFIFRSNNSIAQHQIQGAEQILRAVENPTLLDPRQKEFQIKYLEKWKLPEWTPDFKNIKKPFEIKSETNRMQKPFGIRAQTNRIQKPFGIKPEINRMQKPAEINQESFNMYSADLWGANYSKNNLNFLDINRTLFVRKQSIDWPHPENASFIPIGKFIRLFLSQGDTNIAEFHQMEKTWLRPHVDQRQANFILPSKSLIYGEIIKMNAANNVTKFQDVFVIHDALFLNGIDLRCKINAERARIINEYINTLDQNVNTQLPIIAFKRAPIGCLERFLDSKKSTNFEIIHMINGQDYKFKPNGLLFVEGEQQQLTDESTKCSKTINDPFSMESFLDIYIWRWKFFENELLPNCHNKIVTLFKSNV